MVRSLESGERARRGFTLVEMLVVIAIISILILCAIPAVLASREISRRGECQARLLRISLATQEFEGARSVFPSGTTDDAGPIRNEAKGKHHSWAIPLLPFLEEGGAARRIVPAASVYDDVHKELREYNLIPLRCPSEQIHGGAFSNFAAVHHDAEAPIDVSNNGSFFLNSRLRRDDLADGSSYTLFFGEKRIESGDLGWMSGTRAMLRNTAFDLNHDYTVRPAPPPPAETQTPPDNGPPGFPVPPPSQPATPPPPPVVQPPLPWTVDPLYVGGFGSSHPGGLVMMAFGDGQTRVVSVLIAPSVLKKLANRSDGELVSFEEIE